MKRLRRIPLANALIRRAGPPQRTCVRRWRPAALIWRKCHRWIPAHAIRGGSTIIHCTYSPRFNLHFAFGLPVPQVAAALERAEKPRTILVSRQMARTTWLQAIQRTSRTEDHRSSERQTLRTDFVRWRTGQTRSFSKVARIFRLETVGRFFAQAAPVQVPVTLAGRSGERPVRHRATTDRLASQRIWNGVGLRRSNGVAPAETVLPGRPSIPSVQPVGMPELVWRAEDRLQASQAIERGIASATALSMSAAPAPITQTEQFSEPIGRTSRQAFDPALIDRVAEDVIGRVERRIRIERERRGV